MKKEGVPKQPITRKTLSSRQPKKPKKQKKKVKKQSLPSDGLEYMNKRENLLQILEGPKKLGYTRLPHLAQCIP